MLISMPYLVDFGTSLLPAGSTYFEGGTRLDELKELLENVNDSYDDFVKCVYWAARDRKDGIELMINFIRANPDARSDDIMDWLEESGM